MRLRRRLMVVGCLALLLIAGWEVWRLRPLNATERQLVGIWIPSDAQDRPGDPNCPMEFRSDRVLLNREGEWVHRAGTWSAAEGTLVMKFDVPRPAGTWSPLYRTVPDYLSRMVKNGGGFRQTLSVTFGSPDQFRTDVVASHPSLFESTLWWRRAPRQETEADR